jgi:hypothetical protein
MTDRKNIINIPEDDTADHTGAKRRLGAVVPANLVDELERIAQLNDRTMSAELRRALRFYIRACKNGEARRDAHVSRNDKAA